MLKTMIKKVNGNPTVHYALDIESFADHFISFLKSQESLKNLVSLETKETIVRRFKNESEISQKTKLKNLQDLMFRDYRESYDNRHRRRTSDHRQNVR